MTNALAGEFFDIVETPLDKLKSDFVAHMDFLKSLSVYEMTLYKKWMEVRELYRDDAVKSKSGLIKARIWRPTDIFDLSTTLSEFHALRPTIRYVDPSNAEDMIAWRMLRLFAHTMDFDQNPGRFVRFLVEDEATKTFLGAVSIGSDVISIKVRDEWIGWTPERRKAEGGPLTSSAIATCIMATQPFGYNFLGGKLVASLLTRPHIRETWKHLYDNDLVGITTTSLYGAESMYNSIPYWKKLGVSGGRIFIKPDDEFYDQWHHWIQANKTTEYDERIRNRQTESGPPTGIKQKIIDMIFHEVGISSTDYNHGFERGVYYAPLYKNTREYLQEKLTVDKLEPARSDVMEWWAPRAEARYRKLHTEGRLKPETLYYNDLIEVRDWVTARAKYLDQVGR